MISLTPAQARVKRAIENLTRENGRSPTYQEVANRCGLASKTTAMKHIDELVIRGHAVRGKDRCRNIVLLHKPVSRAPDGAPLYFVPIGGGA